MADFDKILMDYIGDGFKFQTRLRGWGREHTGTKKKGGLSGSLSRGLGGSLGKSLLGGDTYVYIAQFLSENPDGKAFQAFLADAEKFAAGLESGDQIDTVLVVTPTKFERKSVAFLVDRTKPAVAKHLEFKVGGAPAVQAQAPKQTEQAVPEPEEPAGPAPPRGLAPSISKPTATHEGDVDIATLQTELPNKSAGEEILFAWDGEYLRPSGKTFKSVLAVTQERGVSFRRLDEGYVAVGPEFRWEAVTRLSSKSEDGLPLLEINDGENVHRFTHPQAGQMARLLYHLRSSREGRRTGYLKERSFDPQLIEACAPAIVGGRYLDAVRSAFVLLETRVREDSGAAENVGGHDLVSFAFQKETGTLSYGRNDDERVGLFMLFEGAFKWFRNEAAHNYYLRDFGRDEALEELSLVDLLLKMSARAKLEKRGRRG